MLTESLQIPRESYEYTIEQRAQVIKNSKILQAIDCAGVYTSKPEIYRLDMPHGGIEHISMLAADPKGYNNFFDALQKRYFTFLRDGDSFLLDALPLDREKLPGTLVHIMSYEKYKDIQATDFIGDSSADGLVYVQTIDTVVLPNDNLYQEGKIVVRISVDTDILFALQRKIYLDEESICETPEEYGHSFVMYGGIPKSACTQIEIIEIGALDYTPYFEDLGLLDSDNRVIQRDKEYARRLQSIQDRLKHIEPVML